MTIEERYHLCTNCAERVSNNKCDGKCKEYWKYKGASEQKAVDVKNVKHWAAEQNFPVSVQIDLVKYLENN